MSLFRTASYVLVLCVINGCGVSDVPDPVHESVTESSAEAAVAEAVGNAEPADPVDEAPAEPADETVDNEDESSAILIAIDTHIDTTQRMLDDGLDPIHALEGGHLDVPRMREGGLTGAFFSIYVSPRRFEGEAAWQRALALTQTVRAFTEAHPDEVSLCLTGDDVRTAAEEGKIAVLMGVEGAQALGTDNPRLALERVRRLYELGNRYMTITWSVDNPLGHSSLGEHPELGLTAMGRSVVRAMNRMGMIVDISHVSDQTFSDVMDIVTKPVLASHSSSRALADIPRNMSDAMIRRVAENGGAVCVNYFTQFIDRAYRLRRRRLRWRNRARFEPLEEQYPYWVDRGAAALALAQEIDPELNPPTLETLADHFAHMVEVGGPESVCLGSDYDGVSELPLGMRDVRDLGRLREVLESRGLPIAPIFGQNVLRVLDAQTVATPRPVDPPAALSDSPVSPALPDSPHENPPE